MKYDFSWRKYSSNLLLILYILCKATSTKNDPQNKENADFAQQPNPEKQNITTNWKH